MGTEQQVIGINKNNIVLYTIEDGSVRAPFIFKDETFWTTQRVMAELFSVNVPAISKHIENIFSEGELLRDSTVSKKEIVRPRELLKKSMVPWHIVLYTIEDGSVRAPLGRRGKCTKSCH